METTVDFIKNKQEQALLEIRSTLHRKIRNVPNLLAPLSFSKQTKLIGNIINSQEHTLSITVTLEIPECGVSKTIFCKKIMMCANSFEEDIADIIRETFMTEGFFLDVTGCNNSIVGCLSEPTINVKEKN